MWFRKRARSETHPAVKKPELCVVCGHDAMEGFGRCYRHLGVVFESHAETGAPETRDAK